MGTDYIAAYIALGAQPRSDPFLLAFWLSSLYTGCHSVGGRGGWGKGALFLCSGQVNFPFCCYSVSLQLDISIKEV